MSKFILKVTRKASGVIEKSDFQTNAEAVDHFEKYKALGYWGKEQYTISHAEKTILHPEIQEVLASPAIPATPDIFDGDGNLITPAQPAVAEVVGVPYLAAWTEIIPAYDEVVPCEYEWEILDKSVEVEADKVKKLNKKLDRISRVDQLKAIDWPSTDTLAELKAIVRILVKEAIKDDE